MTVAEVFKGVSEGGTRIGRVRLEQPPERTVWYCRDLGQAPTRGGFSKSPTSQERPPWGRTPHEKRAAKPNRCDSLSDLADEPNHYYTGAGRMGSTTSCGTSRRGGLGMAQRKCLGQRNRLGLRVSSVTFSPQGIATLRCQNADPLRCSARAVLMTYQHGYILLACRGIPTITTVILSGDSYHLHSANRKVVKPVCNAV